MERTITDVEANESGDSATDTPIPPYVAWICDKLGMDGTARRKFAEIERGRIREFPEGEYPPMEMLVGIDTPALERTPESKLTHTIVDESDDKAALSELFRKGRKLEVQGFTYQYKYGPINREKRYCVWIDDGCFWPEKSSGITWVAVHGADSVCVVTRNLDTMRLGVNASDLPIKKENIDLVLSLFRKSIICEIEDLGDPSSELRQKFQKCIKKPFGVVSANPGPNNIEAFDYDEEKAIEFLKEKIKSDIDFDAYETTKTAIRAFQHLFQKKVKADEIEVSLMDPGCFFSDTAIRNDSGVQDLSDAEIERLLDDSIGEMEIVNPIPEKAKDESGGLSSISRGLIKHL